jgi:hypothetical protein
MSLVPEGERVRRALRWLADRRLEQPDAPPLRLVDEAALRFDLSPRECELLIEFYRQARDAKG